MTAEAPAIAHRPVSAKKRPGDVIFQTVSTFSGSLILAILAAVLIFLLVRGAPALSPETIEQSELLAASEQKLNFFSWVGPLVFGTVWAALLALIMAIPVSLGIAIFITHYAPRKLAWILGSIIDLLAAVPSVVYGLWGLQVLAFGMRPIYNWLAQNASWLPIFSSTPSATGRTIFTAAVVLAIMVLPIMTALCREVFLQTPRLNEEAALALGATRWEMIRLAVLPFGASGIVSAIVLALGRALGETMAVAMVLSVGRNITFELNSATNVSTIAANIALKWGESNEADHSILIASGLVLFAITLGVNWFGRWLIGRNASK